MPASLKLIVSGDRECAFRNSISDAIVSDCYRMGLTVNIDDKDCSVVYAVDGDRKKINFMKLKWMKSASVQVEAAD